MHSVPPGSQPPSWLRDAIRHAAEMNRAIQRSLGSVDDQQQGQVLRALDHQRADATEAEIVGHADACDFAAKALAAERG
jgi:hypothetical protein